MRKQREFTKEETQTIVREKCKEWLNGLKANRSGAAHKLDLEFDIKPGQKYDKIIYSYEKGGASVHAFVDKNTGDIYKAKSWKSPAKGIRFNIHTDLDILVKHADTYGSYLYSDSAVIKIAKAAAFNKANEWRK
jgi:hypothetical protein